MLVGRTMLVGLTMIAAYPAVKSCDFPSACGNISTYKNHTTWTGKQLGNITTDSPPLLVGLICCAIGGGFAKQRSSNITDGVPWSARVLGPSKTRKGQVSVLCIVYDYGAQTTAGDHNHTAGYTPRVAPMPPPTPPPPTCASFMARGSCPNRCFWSDGACASSPPIECGCNTPGGCGNGALCVHVVMNTTYVQAWDYLGDASSYNQTVIKAPPKTFSSRDMWYSMGDGEIAKPTPSLRPFRYCVQYGSSKDDQLGICLSLNGAAFDLQAATSKTLTYFGQWQSQAPFVAEVVIGTNQTVDFRWRTSGSSVPQPLLLHHAASEMADISPPS